ncbi:hypothetical protein [Helicobacter sp.]|nr:hypothetical protein [Helicobacter sp.]
MLYTLFLILLWPIVIFLCYKFICLNISELHRRELESNPEK